MSRKLPDFIGGFLTYVQDTESPKSYMVWAAISMLSNALQRRCYMQWVGETIYPNQYIIIVGPAGLTRKDLPMRLSEEFLSEVGAKICSTKITHEKLIKDLAECENQYIAKNGSVLIQNPLCIISPELSVFMQFQETNLISTLTDLWQGRDNWNYATKHQGSDTVIGPCVNILGATAPEWLPKIFPIEAVGGGLTSRCLFVYEKRKGKIVPWNKPFNKTLKDCLIHDLADIMQLNGEYTFTQDAQDAYEAWYLEYETEIQRTGRFPVDDPKLYSYVARRATHIKKICMALTASVSDDMLITRETWDRSLSYLIIIEKRMHEVFESIGTSKQAPNLQAIWTVIQANPTITRAELLDRFKRDVDLWDMQKIEAMMESLNYLVVMPIENRPKNATYKIIRDRDPDPSLPYGA